MSDSEVPNTLRIRFSIVTINIIFGFLGKEGNITVDHHSHPGLVLVRLDDVQLPVLAVLPVLRADHLQHGAPPPPGLSTAGTGPAPPLDCLHSPRHHRRLRLPLGRPGQEIFYLHGEL